MNGTAEADGNARQRNPFHRPRRRTLSIMALVCAVAALTLSPISPLSPAHAARKNMQYNGGANGVFTTVPRVYLVYWGPQWGASRDPFQAEAEGFLKGLGTAGDHWSTIMTQYCSGIPAGKSTCPADAPHIPYPDGQVFGGTWFDTSDPGPKPDYAAEGAAALNHFQADKNRAIFVLFGPNQNFGGGNGWHSASTGYHLISIPSHQHELWVLTHEYAEELTDVDAGWNAPADSDPFPHAEIGDLCGPGGSVTMATGTFAVSTLWSNKVGACVSGE
ncbi:MAG TPA: hypothetical protein VI248_08330 [Kineosporiaceae bacterium]